MARGPASIEELEARLSEPSEALVHAMAEIDGDVLILGAGGKMGPTLARMARRAADAAGHERRVLAASRFRDTGVREQLEADGIRTIEADLLDEHRVQRLPKCPNVIYLVGVKFGTLGDEPRLWATNAYLPAVVARHFRGSRIVCLSTGNVYGLVPVATGRGSVESDAPHPLGEYAMSCLARERVLEYFSAEQSTPVVILRLNYAAEMRYGVLVDLATRIMADQPVSLAMGYFNVIWQGDACDFVLRSLACAAAPPLVLNITGPETVSCREMCLQIGRKLGREPVFEGSEAPTALLSDASESLRRFGLPRISLDELVDWTAEWIARGGDTWQKPTHFEVRDGKF